MISANRPKPIFLPGQLVKHRRYEYRGVVVDVDPLCRASEQWYKHNQTQPDRDQPWYHVLVHEAQISTYAAQSSLMEDPSAEPIDHPLVDQFFEEFTGDGYCRNNRPWQL